MQSLNGIQVILFDVDGTLLDTREFILQAFEHTLKTHNLPLHPRTFISTLIGPPIADAYRQLAPEFEDIMILRQTHRDFQFKNLQLSIPFPKSLDVLEELQKRQIHRAAVTTRLRQTAVQTLELGKLLPYIETIVATDDVSNVKPHPEPLFKALDFFNVKPEHALLW